MFRDKYETANNSITPNDELVSETKQKMYEKMMELQNKPATYTNTKRGDDTNMIAKIPQKNQSKVTKFAKIAGSVAACTALVASSVYVTSHYLLSDNNDGNINVAATAAPSPTADSDKTNNLVSTDQFIGSYTATNYCSNLTISGVTDNSFEFTLTIDHAFDLTYEANRSIENIDEPNQTVTGHASFESDSTAVYATNDGITITFEYKNGMIDVNFTNSLAESNNFSATYISTEADDDFNEKEVFASPVILYQGKTYSYDLNNDGKNETISYAGGIITINDVTIDYNDITASPDLDSYTIVDIDGSDDSIELVFMDYGPSDDPVETIISYKADGTYTSSQVGGCTINQLEFDNKGTISGAFRLSLLQTWFADCTWTYKDGEVIFNEQDYYTPYTALDAVTADVELCKAIDLYSKDDLSSKTVTMQPQTVTFETTDNKHWIKVAGNSDGTEGWLYLEDFNIIPSTNESASEYFLNLALYD